MLDKNKRATVSRLNRISGQVQGIARMINDDRYCIDILNQMQAIKSALSKAEDAILKDHAASCVESAIETGSVKEQRKKFDELIELMGKFKR